MGRATQHKAIRGIVVLVLVSGMTAVVLVADPGPPDWSVTPGDFGSNGSIIAAVLTGSTQIGGPGDLLGAFLGGECRGVQESTGLPDDTYIFYLTVYGDTTQGEFLAFKYYDAAADTEAYITENVEFIPDMTVGGTLDPFLMHTSHAPAIGPTTWGAIKALYD